MADTQEEGVSIFRASAMSRIASADDLDKYIKVTNPIAWVVLLAALIMALGLAIWSTTAVIPTTVDFTGVMRDGEVTCWVDEQTAEKIEAGGVKATVAKTEATNLKVGSVPLSSAEVKAKLGSDYLADSVTLVDWNYELTMEVDNKDIKDSDFLLVPVSVTVLETHPLDLVLGKQ